MEPYDQKKHDPEGYWLSLAFICGLVGIGALLDGGPFFGIGVIAIAGAIALFATARSAR